MRVSLLQAAKRQISTSGQLCYVGMYTLYVHTIWYLHCLPVILGRPRLLEDCNIADLHHVYASVPFGQAELDRDATSFDLLYSWD